MSAFASWLMNGGSSSSSSSLHSSSSSDQQHEMSHGTHASTASHLAPSTTTTTHPSPSHHQHHHHHIHFEHKARHSEEEEDLGLMHKLDEEIKSRTCFTRTTNGHKETELFVISTNMQQPPLCNQTLVDNTASFGEEPTQQHDDDSNNHSQLAKKRKYQYYRTCAMDYDEVSHLSAALYGDEVCYFPSDYGSSLRKLLCCRIVPNKSSSDIFESTLKEENNTLSNRSDKAADHADFPQYNGIKATLGRIVYSAANDVYNENSLLFRGLCTDHVKGKVYL